MRQYKDPLGGLTIDKTENAKPKRARKLVERVVEPKDVPASLMIETAYSYQQAIFTSNCNENGGSTCVFCGDKTSFDNRHVCVDCWKKYKDEIFEGIKKAVEDTEIRIE